VYSSHSWLQIESVKKSLSGNLAIHLRIIIEGKKQFGTYPLLFKKNFAAFFKQRFYEYMWIDLITYAPLMSSHSHPSSCFIYQIPILKLKHLSRLLCCSNRALHLFSYAYYSFYQRSIGRQSFPCKVIMD